MQVSVELTKQDLEILNELVRIGDGAFTRQQILDTAVGLGVSFISQEVIDATEKRRLNTWKSE